MNRPADEYPIDRSADRTPWDHALCDDCTATGHICRPCRAERYEGRQPIAEARDTAAVVLFVLSAIAAVVGWAMLVYYALRG
jgi:hypothetical protein